MNAPLLTPLQQAHAVNRAAIKAALTFDHLATMDDAGLRYRRIYAELEMSRNDILGSRRGHPDNPYFLGIADRYRAELVAVEAQMELRR